MTFDDEIDALKRVSQGALADLLRALEQSIQSERLSFAIWDGAGDGSALDQPVIVVGHHASEEVLGEILSYPEGFAFETEHPGYFPEFLGVKDKAAFATKLRDTLKTGLPGFERDFGA